MRATATLALAAAAAGCGWRRTPVQVISDTGSNALLVGSWAGDYDSRDTGRKGTISFELESEKDTAYCDVVMIPKVGNFRVAPEQRPDIPVVTPQTLGEPLKIQFIRLGDGRITGTLEPYTDPECGCKVTTTFEGTFRDANKIAGTYVTRGSGGYQTTGGTWNVKRQSVAKSAP
jgi:hypothetical protein